MTKASLIRGTAELRTFAASQGADFAGIADLRLYYDQYGFSKSLLEEFPFAVSIAVRLSDSVIDAITKEDPTETYVHHYSEVNTLLNRIALKVANYIQTKGFRAVSVSASQVSDEQKLLGSISHKGIAALGGAGWLGKSSLLINEKFGPRIRLVSVLTTLPLIPDRPVENRCGDCRSCVEACPEGAIRGLALEERGSPREQYVDVQACNRRLLKIAGNPRYGKRICGLCIKVCPWGKRA